jgi:cell division septal protein FtsQ
VGSDVVLTLVDGITVRIGDTSRLTAKFVAVEALLDQAGRATIESLDVRVPSSPSLVPVPGADRETGSSLTGEPGAGA